MALSKDYDVSLQLVKHTSDVFYWINEIFDLEDKRSQGKLSQKELSNYEDDYNRYLRKIHRCLVKLFDYGVILDSFTEVLDGTRYISLIKKAYNLSSDDNTFSGDRYHSFRLQNSPYVNKKAAIRELKMLIKAVKSSSNLFARVLFKDTINSAAEEIAYAFRDWLINDFDTVIETIEPLRQEYIISRKGDVDPEEVDDYLQSQFEGFSTYNNYLFTRANDMDLVYFPDLKI